MNLIIKRFFLAGLMTLPSACVQFYDSGYGYYPNQHDSGYGAMQPDYYSADLHLAPVYRTGEIHYSDDYSSQDPARISQADHRPLPVAASPNHYRDLHAADKNRHDNLNAQTAKHFGNRQTERDRPHVVTAAMKIDRPALPGQTLTDRSGIRKNANEKLQGVKAAAPRIEPLMKQARESNSSLRDHKAIKAVPAGTGKIQIEKKDQPVNIARLDQAKQNR